MEPQHRAQLKPDLTRELPRACSTLYPVLWLIIPTVRLKHTGRRTHWGIGSRDCHLSNDIAAEISIFLLGGHASGTSNSLLVTLRVTTIASSWLAARTCFWLFVVDSNPTSLCSPCVFKSQSKSWLHFSHTSEEINIQLWAALAKKTFVPTAEVVCNLQFLVVSEFRDLVKISRSTF